jgi:predicted CDP-diglyceride synthetase/phosphatidate cytidylyltransferase
MSATLHYICSATVHTGRPKQHSFLDLSTSIPFALCIGRFCLSSVGSLLALKGTLQVLNCTDHC